MRLKSTFDMGLGIFSGWSETNATNLLQHSGCHFIAIKCRTFCIYGWMMVRSLFLWARDFDFFSPTIFIASQYLFSSRRKDLPLYKIGETSFTSVLFRVFVRGAVINYWDFYCACTWCERRISFKSRNHLLLLFLQTFRSVLPCCSTSDGWKRSPGSVYISFEPANLSYKM